MLRYFIISSIILFSFCQTSFAENYLEKHIQSPKIIGSSKFKVMFWHVYDASLYSTDGKFSFDKTFALKLDYKRKLEGEKIAERSAEEMRKIGFNDEVTLAGWFSQMRSIFPNVDNGNYITGIYIPGENTIFYMDGKKIGEISDKEFGKWFFGIWLSKKTSEPELRSKLLGIR
ncbi:MAG: chalcone isomerase family protein [Rickettsiales bacterium]|nr:chalcone isomerase family protein [Pseudomonadota bacterium]MDA0966202.1 chalcone isomerase family protein [Pseudomonadota bacterium]MDG4543133.1 chalcone isomerase family protein [Rickettsiales bacterium]MDG4545331.1 chalcone isomerase family protein [Rickettsiales bacterium]MDG4547780.1 chalcone isomerase family protein [Rickettsiales bacterium]